MPFTFHPDPVGGTEVYVEALARELQALGEDVAVAASSQRTMTEQYEWRGVAVYRYPLSAREPSLPELYELEDREAARGFCAVLSSFQPDLVHFHALTAGSSPAMAREAKARGVPVVYTYHTPTTTCARGTLLRWGATSCTGRMRERLCASCVVHARVGSRPLAGLAALVPDLLAGSLGSLGLEGGIWTAIRLRSLLKRRHAVTRGFFDGVDRVVVLARWCKEVLRLNGVPGDKISTCAHGLCHPSPRGSGSDPMRAESPGPLKLAFLGRLDPVKGVDLLLDALSLRPHLDLRLDLFAIRQGRSDYADGVTLRIAEDPRVRLHDPCPADQVLDTLRTYDALLVPSRWLETGPLVVLEAFAAGVPVIGSDLGGIRDKVRHGIDGLLVPLDSHEAWASALERFARDPALRVQLRRGVRRPRTQRDVAREMLQIYRELLGDAR